MKRFIFRLAVIFSWMGLCACRIALPAAEGEFERALDVAGPVTLEVRTGSGGITIR